LRQDLGDVYALVLIWLNFHGLSAVDEIPSSTLFSVLCQLFLFFIIILFWMYVAVALSAKECGNECFKAKDFVEAIRSYSRSIDHSPTAAAYANRAAAYLKISGYSQAEDDCTEALKLDDQYMKAYARRAIARKELGKLVEAEEDAKLCLKLDPKQDDVQKLLGEVNFLLEKVKNYVLQNVIITLLSYAIYLTFKWEILLGKVTSAEVSLAFRGYLSHFQT